MYTRRCISSSFLSARSLSFFDEHQLSDFGTTWQGMTGSKNLACEEGEGRGRITPLGLRAGKRELGEWQLVLEILFYAMLKSFETPAQAASDRLPMHGKDGQQKTW